MSKPPAIASLRQVGSTGMLNAQRCCGLHAPRAFFGAGFAFGQPSSSARIRTAGTLPGTKRSLFTRRSTSFWTQSYPPQSYGSGAISYPGGHDDGEHSIQVPYVPPLPGDHSQGSSSRPGVEEGRTQRKQRYLDSLMDKAGELSLRCSVLDASGEWTAEEGKYKKVSLCKEYDLDPRDLRKLDSFMPNLVPVILTRRTCILISMLHIRALIKPDRVIIFDQAGSVESEIQRRFRWHLERNIKAGLEIKEEDGEGEGWGLSYEHRALESILVATANALEEEMAFTRQLVQKLLADLEADIDRDNLRRLLHYSRRIVGFQSRARHVKRAVDEVLDNDEDLSAMYLTSRAQGRPRALHDHEQLELLLESFTKQVEEIVSEIDTTVANMQSTQEIAELMLDSGRNALLALDVKLSVATVGLGTGALVASTFGMNLTSSLETTPYAFWVASGSAAFISILIVMFGIRTLKRVGRVALTGQMHRSVFHSSLDHPALNNPAWREFMAADPITGVPAPSGFRLGSGPPAGPDGPAGEAARRGRGPRSVPRGPRSIVRAKGSTGSPVWNWLFRRRASRQGDNIGGRPSGPVPVGASAATAAASGSDYTVSPVGSPAPLGSAASSSEPVYINPRADLARARDAMLYAQMNEDDRRWAADAGGPAVFSSDSPAMQSWKDGQRAWRDKMAGGPGAAAGGFAGEDQWGCDPAPWKWGKARHKWAKD